MTEAKPDVVDTEELLYRIDRLENEVILAKRAAQTTRAIAIAAAVFFLGLPLLIMLFNMVRFAF